ncbi:MAG: N-acetylglucosamine-6-phosphate deacetylase [Eubacteriales bacterium]|nr:N-acetylglucosamine-6-phosphate deacetylase [Eubacteriales bacterium]MDD3866061.1 N-acetylglucosamine-6-phosphate deacetylase [Eubacteriales bacterium]MDD4460871.1 N-acetylglucosamine-6-phosphate deacetylase [Eubacteriales bacterium]
MAARPAGPAHNSILLRHIEYLDADFVWKQGDILLTGDRITAIDAPSAITAEAAEQIIEGQSLRLYPGLIDLHTHGAVGSDTMDATTEGLEKISRFLAVNGTTAFLATSMSSDRQSLEHVFRQPPSVSGAAILGYHMEGPFLNSAKAGAMDPRHLRRPDISELRQYQHIRRITVAPEMDGALEFIRLLTEETGIKVSLGHTVADYQTGLAAFAQGAQSLTHLYNAMPPLLHRDPGIIAAAIDSGAAAELISDGFHVHPAMVRVAWKLFGSQRLALISDAMRATGLADGTYDLGGQTVYVRQGEARLADGHIAGSTVTLWQCLHRAHAAGIPLQDAARMASATPAELLGEADERGRIRKGLRADLILADGSSIRQVWIGGQAVL